MGLVLVHRALSSGFRTSADRTSFIGIDLIRGIHNSARPKPEIPAVLN